MKITRKDAKRLNRKDDVIYVIFSIIILFFFCQVHFKNFPDNKFEFSFLTIICINYILCFIKVKDSNLNNILTLYFIRWFSTIVSLLIIVFYLKEKLHFSTDFFYINISFLLLAPYLLLSIKGSSLAKRKQTHRLIHDLEAYLYRRQSNKICIETKEEGKRYILPKDIIYIKSNGRDKIIYINKGSKSKNQQNYFDELTTYKYNLEELLKLLPPKKFKRINKSTIINTDYLYRIKGSNQYIKIKKGEFEKQFSLSNKFYTDN